MRSVSRNGPIFVSQSKVVPTPRVDARRETDGFGVGHPVDVRRDVLDAVPHNGRRSVDDDRHPDPRHIAERSLWQTTTTSSSIGIRSVRSRGSRRAGSRRSRHNAISASTGASSACASSTSIATTQSSRRTTCRCTPRVNACCASRPRRGRRTAARRWVRSTPHTANRSGTVDASRVSTVSTASAMPHTFARRCSRPGSTRRSPMLPTTTLRRRVARRGRDGTVTHGRRASARPSWSFNLPTGWRSSVR